MCPIYVNSIPFEPLRERDGANLKRLELMAVDARRLFKAVPDPRRPVRVQVQRAEASRGRNRRWRSGIGRVGIESPQGRLRLALPRIKS
jgi:hypothetical protein